MKRTAIMQVVVLLVLTMGTLIALDRPLIRGDGTAYLAWLDTFVRDQDLNLENQAERFQPVNTYQVKWDAELGRYVNIFPFGVAFLEAPFFAAGGLLTATGLVDQNPSYFLQMQGVNQAYGLMIMAGTNLMILAALVLIWQIVRGIVDGWTAVLVAWGFLMGTPLVYYATVAPLNSHAPGAFLTTVLVFLMMRVVPLGQEANRPSLIIWLLIGAVAGLMVLVRWQLAAVVALAWLLMAAQRSNWRGLAVATGAAVIVMLPLPVVWNQMFGKPFVVPYDETTGESFFHLPAHAHRVFFRMLTHSPLLLLSLAGIPFLWRKDRRWAAFCAGTIVLQLMINGSTKDWYAGDSYGARRMSELYPIYALLAAALLGQFSRAALPVLARTVFVGVLVYSIVFLFVFFVFSWTNPDHYFADEPDRMWEYFIENDERGEIIETIFRTHLGPRAWDHPGP